MTKKEQREFVEMQARIEKQEQQIYSMIKVNTLLRKQLGEFDFTGWNESGYDEIMGNPWHIKWSDYILEFVSHNTFSAQTEETLLDVLKKCFRAGMDYGVSLKTRNTTK